MSPTDSGRRWERLPTAATSDGGSRPQVLVLLERPNPAQWPLRQVTWLARRLRAELLIATVVIYDHGLDQLDRLRVGIVREGLEEVRAQLMEQGIQAAVEVALARHGEQAAAASDLADRLDPDLLVVLARHGSRFRLFPGSRLAHRLMRGQHRPVLVIPDREGRRTWRSVLL